MTDMILLVRALASTSLCSACSLRPFMCSVQIDIHCQQCSSSFIIISVNHQQSLFITIIAVISVHHFHRHQCSSSSAFTIIRVNHQHSHHQCSSSFSPPSVFTIIIYHYQCSSSLSPFSKLSMHYHHYQHLSSRTIVVKF